MSDYSLPQNDILASALRYQELGLSVIPLNKDKTPQISAWKRYQQERATSEQIKDWWHEFPDANVAIVTGAISGIVVIDVEAGGSTDGLPLTVASLTGGGGRHFYCKHPGKPFSNSIKKVRELTDIRGDGGYVVAPPSVHESGKRYEWDSMFPLEGNISSLADLPAWVTERSIQKPVSEPLLIDGLLPRPAVGDRHRTAMRLIGKIVHQMPMFQEYREILYLAFLEWNKTHVSPSLPEKDLGRMWNYVIENESSKQSVIGGIHQLDPPISYKELCEKEFQEVKWAIEGLFESGTINMISAAPNQYKSWIVHHMAICLARGERVFGHFMTERQNVLIVNEEDTPRMLKARSLMLSGEKTDIPVFFTLNLG